MNLDKIQKIIPLADLRVGVEVGPNWSRLTFHDDKNLYVVYSDSEEVQVGPGIHIIRKEGSALGIKPMQLRRDLLFKDHEVTKLLYDYTTTFFERCELLMQRKQRVVHYGFLLVGPPGCGKTAAISHVCQHYSSLADTAIIFWQSDSFQSWIVKDFLHHLRYEPSVKRIIFVIEDLGGTESIENEPLPVDPALLSILDNSDLTFPLPAAIYATTNYPEQLLENLLDRRGRFDKVIEVEPPTSKDRVRLLNFFSHDAAPEDALEEVRKSEYDGLSVAHLEAVVDDHVLFQIPYLDSLRSILGSQKKAKKGYRKNRSPALGLGTR